MTQEVTAQEVTAQQVTDQEVIQYFCNTAIGESRMTISVRMDALLERELALVAKQRGITKSQFVIEAVERALGHKDPYQLLLQVRDTEVAQQVKGAAEPGRVATGDKASSGERVSQKLKDRHAIANAEWVAQRGASTPSPGAD